MGRTLLAASKPTFNDVNATTLTGSEALLSNAGVSNLQSTIGGTLLQAHSPGYDAARTLWNTMIDKHMGRCGGPGGAAGEGLHPPQRPL